MLYSHLDLIMADKNHYERCTRDLFVDLGLRGSSYRYASNRKQVLSRGLNELVGLRINTGIIETAVIEKTKDGKDYRLVAQKAPLRSVDEGSTLPAAVGVAADRRSEPVIVNHYCSNKDPLHL